MVIKGVRGLKLLADIVRDAMEIVGAEVFGEGGYSHCSPARQAYDSAMLRIDYNSETLAAGGYDGRGVRAYTVVQLIA